MMPDDQFPEHLMQDVPACSQACASGLTFAST